MSEKLTKVVVDIILHEDIEPSPRTERAVERIWTAIRLDREAIRAEVTEELLKDHFKIGEKAELLSDFWERVTFGFKTKDGYFIDDVSNGSFHFRRPPKTRPMTREEMVKATDIDNVFLIASQLKTETLFDILKASNISTEVPL